MSLSRRAFVRTLGFGGAGILTGVAGGRPAVAGVQLNRRYDAGFINLSSNTSPRGPSGAVLEALRGRITPRVGRYPDNVATLVEAIAARNAVKPESVLLSTGSGEELDAAVRAFVSRTRGLVVASPTYESPERLAKELAFPLRSVPVDAAQQLDLDAMVSSAKGAGLVYICNPNNPTALVKSAGDIAAFVGAVKRTSPDTAILIDEAYLDFADQPGVGTAAPLAHEHPGVFVTRTFSKVYGMAGLRLGYATGQPATLKALDAAWGLGSVNVLTAAAGLAALNDAAHVRWEVEENRKVRDYTLGAFREIGYRATDSQTNFVWVDVRRPSKEFRETCFKQGVLVGRDFPPMTTYSRISLGSLEEMQKAMAIFRKVLT